MEQPIFQPKTKEEHLALEIAEKLGDPKALPLYVKIAQKNPEHRIRLILNKVLKVPDDRIRTSRGAYFNWLIHHHEDT